MSRPAKAISISAKESADDLSRDRARIGGGVKLDDPQAALSGEVFRVLWAAFLPALTKWNHAHVFDPFWRLYFNKTPGNHIVFGAERIPLHKGTIVIIPANVLFRTYSGSKAVSHFCAHFTVSPSLVFPSPKPLVLPADPMARAMISDLSDCLARESVEKIFCRHRCLALLHLLFAPVLEHLHPHAAKRGEIAKVLQAVEVNPMAFAASDEMAKFAGMSSRNFQRHFQKAMAKSPSSHLREVRLREAARQLAQPGLSIDAIAENLGFSNRFHFSRLFREFTGTPPASFRKEKLSGG